MGLQGVQGPLGMSSTLSLQVAQKLQACNLEPASNAKATECEHHLEPAERKGNGVRAPP